VDVREIRDEDELQAAIDLRREVFVGEQGVPLCLEVDDHDPVAIHLVAVERGRVMGTLRLLDDGDAARLGRLAVQRAARRRGLARRLLDAAEAWAREHGRRRIVLSAQTYALTLYEGAGYVRQGDVYTEAGIEHVRMERDLA